MSTTKIPQRSYHAGETVGDFKVIRFDREKIAFDWNGKTVERGVMELRPKENATAQPAQVASGTPATAAKASETPSALRPVKAGSNSSSGTNVTALGGASGEA